jgi:hypothetical protein
LKSKITEESREKLKKEITEEILSQLDKKQVKFDQAEIDNIVTRLESKIPRVDNPEIIKGLLSEIVTNEDEKRIDFYRDEVFSEEIKNEIGEHVLDQIETPKDGEKGDRGEKGDPGQSAQPIPLTERDKKEIADLIDVTKLIKDRKQDLVKLVEQLKSGKIKLPSHAGIVVKEIIAEFNKIIGHTNWQDRGLAISNDGTEIAVRPDENYSTDDNIDVTSTDNESEDRIDTVISISDNPNFDSILFNKDVSEPVEEVEGLVRWNDTDLTLDIVTGLGPVMQVGQEMYVFVYNGTGEDIADCVPVYPIGGFNGFPSVDLSNSDTHVKIAGVVLLTTMTIPDGTVGITSRQGKVRNCDTSDWEVGDTLWVSPDADGELVNTKPTFPDYVVQVGGVTVKDAEEGEIIIEIKGEPEDTIVNYFNGTFRETINFTVSSDGDDVTGSLSPDNGHPDMTMMFSDGFSMLTATPPATIALTPGTDDNPQQNFVYVLQSTKALTLSTSDWPTAEHIKVANISLRTAATTMDEGALANRNWNDHIENTTTFQGHMPHIGEKLRQFEAQWHSGSQGSASGFPSNVYIANTSGVVYQLHKQPFPAMSMPTDDIHIVNNQANPFYTTDNLNTETLDALGVTLANSSFSFVVWGVQNRVGQASHLMCNLPTGKYAKNSPSLAVADAFNYSVYDVPKQFQGTGFLIARFTFVLDAAGTAWTLHDTEDLRGKVPNTTAGGGAGGTGVTTWTGLTDTPSAFVGEGIPRVNAGGTALDFTTLLKSGATQVAAGAAAGEFWRTSSHATLPDNVVLQGV